MKTILVDAWNTFLGSDGVNKELFEMLETFPNTKIIVTNANPEERKELGMVGMPYRLYSLNHEPEKTDSEYFDRLMIDLDLEPEQLIYFEHNLQSVESARAVGIKSFHFDHINPDYKSLENFLIENA